jgi:hypothetical protein
VVSVEELAAGVRAALAKVITARTALLGVAASTRSRAIDAR